MKEWNECPYCIEELAITDVYDTSDGYIDEGFTMCPKCHKAFVHTTEVKVDFEITSVENQLQDANMRVNFIDAELYKPRQTFLKKLLAYNKMIDDGVLTEEEIEEYSDEWSDGYE